MAVSKLNRFPFKKDSLFSGCLVDRDRPMEFKLDGRTYQGIAGDTVLSALLASGIDAVGQMDEQLIALDSSICPPVVSASMNETNPLPLPMDRTPLLENMELVTFSRDRVTGRAQHTFLEKVANVFSNNRHRTLDYNLSASLPLPGPWHDLLVSETRSTDLVVVGGGVAGLSAALAAANHGWRVDVIERRPELGGDARFFGSVEGEQRPEDFIAETITLLKTSELVKIHTNTLALSLSGCSVKVHRVMEREGRVHTDTIRFESKKVILATGTLERLPVFPGNRLPGVIKARDAYHLAARYGVWHGKNAAFCTSSSAATQVALLAADMDVKVAKLADSRAKPKSRFFEFAKAYGISLATGTQVVSTTLGTKGNLEVDFGLALNSSQRVGNPLTVQRLVVCGGWQPDLTLWHGAGGSSKWSAPRHQLLAYGTLEGVVLAGSSAGELSMTACAEGGKSAFYQVSGTPETTTNPRPQSAEFESDDGELPVVRNDSETDNGYLDSGFSFTKPAWEPKPSLFQRLMPARNQDQSTFAQELSVLSLNDVVAKVVLDEIPAEFAGIIAEERCVEPGNIVVSSKPPRQQPDHRGRMAKPFPAYLSGRFGNRASVVALKAQDDEVFEVGCLVYPDTELMSPAQAIGVVTDVQHDNANSAKAYVDLSTINDKQKIVVRNSTHIVSAVIFKPEE